MAGGKETPRQKMIGMMYLVLTALLAMNISKDVLNAFVQINRGLVKNSANSEERANATLGLLDSWSDKEKAAPFQAKAHEIVEKADALVKHIVEMKARVVACSEDGSSDGSSFDKYMKNNQLIDLLATENGSPIISKLDENQNTTGMLIGDEPNSPKDGPWSAKELRGKLQAFSDECQNVSVTDLKGVNHVLAERAPETKALIDSTFKFSKIPDAEGKPEEWETALFYHTPLAAVIAHLSKIESDVILIKNTVLNYLASQINASDLKFSDVTVAVVPKQSYILRGDSFVAEIYLAAYNKASKTKVYMGGEVGEGAKPELFDYAGREAIVSGSDGKCKFKINESALGSHSHKGVIVYQDADGADKAIPFIIPPFIVGDVGGVVVSATQMNVFYTSVPNPVSVSVPGVDPSNISVSMSGGSIASKGNGLYEVTCPSVGSGKATINVTAMINGKSVAQPPKEFFIKQLPDPVAKFGGASSSSSTLSLNGANLTREVVASMPAWFNFQGISLSITGFGLTVTGAGKNFDCAPSRNGQLTQEMLTAIAKAKKGERLLIYDITCNQNGQRVGLNNITVKLN
jgi:gliding motility-associated protein GldM